MTLLGSDRSLLRLSNFVMWDQNGLSLDKSGLSILFAALPQWSLLDWCPHGHPASLWNSFLCQLRLPPVWTLNSASLSKGRGWRAGHALQAANWKITKRFALISYLSRSLSCAACCPGLKNISPEIIKAGRQHRSIFKVQTKMCSKLHCLGVMCWGTLLKLSHVSKAQMALTRGRQRGRKPHDDTCESSRSERRENTGTSTVMPARSTKRAQSPWHTLFSPGVTASCYLSLQLSDGHLKSWITGILDPMSPIPYSDSVFKAHCFFSPECAPIPPFDPASPFWFTLGKAYCLSGPEFCLYRLCLSSMYRSFLLHTDKVWFWWSSTQRGACWRCEYVLTR